MTTKPVKGYEVVKDKRGRVVSLKPIKFYSGNRKFKKSKRAAERLEKRGMQ